MIIVKFNEKQSLGRELRLDPTATRNHEGGLAFEMDAKTKLVTTVLASFVEGKFYQSRSQVINELRATVKAVLDVDPEFVLKLAVYARKVMLLRSVPLFLLNEYANSGARVSRSRKYVYNTVERVDEITELLALSMDSRKANPEKFGNKKASMFILRGIAPAFNKFDEYQFSKYKGEGNAVSLKDALLMTHPCPKDKEQQALFDAIVNGTLAPPETWEVTISGSGASKESWESILPKMGYMALLRNLNNFIRHGVDLEQVISKLTNPVAIKKSKQYPFRYFSAYKAIKDAGYSGSEGRYASAVLNALEKAMELSVENVPKIPGKSLVLVDVSGSMSWRTISDKSKVTPAEIASLFGAISSKICDNAQVVVFADQFGVINFVEGSGMLKRMETITRANVGGGTEAHLPMEFARQKRVKYDRVFLFSDMQCYASGGYGASFAKSFTAYQREVEPAFLYSCDLVGYGTAQVPQSNDKVLMLSGFSEKLFDFVPKFEADRASLVKEIEGYKV